MENEIKDTEIPMTEEIRTAIVNVNTDITFTVLLPCKSDDYVIFVQTVWYSKNEIDNRRSD